MKHFFPFILCSWTELDNDAAYHWASPWVCADRRRSAEVPSTSSAILGDLGDSGCSSHCYFSDIIFLVSLELSLQWII